MGSSSTLGLMSGVDAELLLTLKSSGKSSSMSIGSCLIVTGSIFTGDWVRLSVDRSDFVLKWARGGRPLEESMVSAVWLSSDIPSPNDLSPSSRREGSLTWINCSIWYWDTSGCCFWRCLTQLALVENPMSQRIQRKGFWGQLLWERRWCFRARKNLKSSPQYLHTVSGDWKFSVVLDDSATYLLYPMAASISSFWYLPCFFL